MSNRSCFHDESSWRNGLQAGDDIVVCWSSIHGARYDERKVDRITKTLIISGNFRFSKSDGYHGARYANSVTIAEPTSELLGEIHEQKRRDDAIRVIQSARLDNNNVLSNLNVSQLEALVATLLSEGIVGGIDE